MVTSWTPRWAVQCNAIQSFPPGAEYSGADQPHWKVCIWTELRKLSSSEGRPCTQCTTILFKIHFCIRIHTFGKSTFCYPQNRLQGIQRSWSRWQSACCWSMTNLYWLKHHKAQKMKANQKCCDLFFFFLCLLAMNYATAEKWGWFCFLSPMCKRGVMPLSSVEFEWVSGKSHSGPLSNPAPHLVGVCISPSFSQELFVCIFPLCVSLYFPFLWSLKS